MMRPGLKALVATGLVAGFAVLAGCATEEKSETTASSDTDLSLRGPRLLGTIEPGETKAGYFAPPLKRAWAFLAKAGDTVTILVHSDVGDAMAYLTDDHYNVLAYNDDAGPNTQDAKIVLTIPPSCAATSFRIVFGDYNNQPAPFDVTLNRTGPTDGLKCTYNSGVYEPGNVFPADDGCNTCTCDERGNITCTKNVCACDPAHEPNKVYKGTPKECAYLGYSCDPGQVKFSNQCGCGCLWP